MKKSCRLLEPIALGRLLLPDRIFYAPLAGCSDYPFRMMAAKYRPSLMFCEMVKMDPLVRGCKATLRLLDYHKSMHPIGAQLCGSKAELAGEAARLIEALGFDIIDLNCGCPVDKVTKDGSGSGLLRNPALIGKIVHEMVSAVKVPVTVKIRAGWDEDSINAAEVTRIAYDNGAAAVTVHARTREQGYCGAARWGWIAEVKQMLPQTILVGNGDLFDHTAAERIVEETNCDAILLSRGTLGQPWLAEQIRSHLKGEEVKPKTVAEIRSELYEHFKLLTAYEEERRALLHMRKIGCWYFKEIEGIRVFREKISKALSLAEVEELILNYPFHP